MKAGLMSEASGNPDANRLQSLQLNVSALQALRRWSNYFSMQRGKRVTLSETVLTALEALRKHEQEFPIFGNNPNSDQSSPTGAWPE